MSLATDGRWTPAQLFPVSPPVVNDGHGHSFTDTRGLFVLHAVLLHTGKVLCFCGHVELSMYAPLCYEFDPKNPTTAMAAISFPPEADLFCCHYVQIFDGRILAAGGSELHDLTHAGFVSGGSTGAKTIGLYDPMTSSWSISQSWLRRHEMDQGRWYPTLVSLPDARVAVFSGRRESGSGVASPSIADAVEIIAPPSSSDGQPDWSATEVSGANKALPIYPGLHLAPNGRIYYTHTNWGQEMAEPDTASLLIASGATSGTWTPYPGRMPAHPRREEGMSVLLPPAQDGKILVIGGSMALNAAGVGLLQGGGGTGNFHHIADSSDPTAADVLDTTVDPPTWTPVGPMNHGRINGHCVILPDETVFICGGHNRYKWHKDPPTIRSLTAEIFTPGVGFREVCGPGEPAANRMTDSRMYHSVALLLPDGRVFTAGGADDNFAEPTITYPSGWVGRQYISESLNQKSFQLYEPPYMHNPPRPVIQDVLRNNVSTARIEYGQQFVVRTPQAASIQRVALMRPGACTHHTDTEQRYVRLNFTAGSGELTVTAVADPKLAPPGYYMLWIVDDQKRPCEEARFIRLMPLPGQPGGGTSCIVATVTLGSPDHADVAYLQALRQELRVGTRAGRHFIAIVNRVYGSFSPALAHRLSGHTPARTAVRDTLVRPIIATVAATDRLARRLSPRSARHAALMLLFTIESAVGILLLPLLVAAVLIRIALACRASREVD
jgi:hypothetical protein